MKVLFLTISFSEADHISFYEELLQEFVKNGHEVYVACASEKRKNRKSAIFRERGITILRIETGNITGDISIIEKGISTVMIDSTFKRAIKKYYENIKFDLVLYPTPPITLVNTVKWIKKRDNARTYLLLKDIFPQNAVDLGMLSKKGIKAPIYYMFREKEKKLYGVSNYIGCMSQANVDYVLKHNLEIEASTVEVCPNSVKLISVKKNSDVRLKYGIPEDKTIFVYGGNLGRPQGIGFVLKCLKQCKGIEEAVFLIVGGGAEAAHIKEFIKEEKITNVIYMATLPKDEYEELAGNCDVGLIFLDYRFTIPNFPSRILSYMQSAMPVLVASDPNTDMGRIVVENGFGWWCESNDAEAFEKYIREAITADKVEMGKKARKYMEENYDVRQGYEIIMARMEA